MLAAGLDGIRRELKPGDPVNIDTYKMSEAELAAQGIRRLPWTLGEAIDAFEESEFVPEVLGAELHASYAELKRAEWQEYNTVVSEWEQTQVPAPVVTRRDAVSDDPRGAALLAWQRPGGRERRGGPPG